MAPQALPRSAALAAARRPDGRARSARSAPAAPLARRAQPARRLPARLAAAAAAAAAAPPPPALPRQRGALRPAAAPVSPARARRPGASRPPRGSVVRVSAASGFAPAAAVASLVHAAGFSSLLEALASLLGLAMGAGSLLLYSPIVLRLWRTRSADGMAASTWALQLFGFTAVCIYNTSKGFPIAAYAETLSFAVQARARARACERERARGASGDRTRTALSVASFDRAWACRARRAAPDARAHTRASRYPLSAACRAQSGAILLLVAHLQRRLHMWPFAAGAAAYVALLAAGAAGLPDVALSALQLVATVSVTGALLPQLWLNARRRSSGGWSPVTAGLSAAGNALRVFTTLQLTRDALLLAGFLAGFTVNAVLLAQIYLYGDGKAVAVEEGGHGGRDDDAAALSAAAGGVGQRAADEPTVA
jgi:hypothetical protein